MSIISCSFTSNSAKKNGGGIDNAGNMNLIDCSFTSNNANWGGVYTIQNMAVVLN